MSFIPFAEKPFEQLVRSLALKVFGPGVTIFGPGPDGGREASFEGDVPFPNSVQRWNGYGVIQAKCKDRTGGTQLDQEWALKLLKSELDAFAQCELATNRKVPASKAPNTSSKKRARKGTNVPSEPKKRTKLPEYFVFATNVDLTSASQAGGKDQAESLIKSYYDSLPLKGHAIWDAIQLAALIGEHHDLRNRFFDYLTPGDVLAAMARSIDRTAWDVERTCHVYLDSELQRDVNSKLEGANVRTEEQTPLARVFIELDATEVAPGQNAEGKKLLQELIETGDLALDPESIESEMSFPDSGRDEEVAGRFVVVGGPGSGKSTLCQFLAQIHRATLLHPRKGLEPNTRQIIRQIIDHCEASGIPLPTRSRFPFRVDLSRYARDLAVNKSATPGSLYAYLYKQLSVASTGTLQDFVKWLHTVPVLLILDGLDEVPHTSNREQVCETIREALAEARMFGADVLAVATTRPQGYNNEFGRYSFDYRFICPLTLPRAIEYAKLVARSKFGGDENAIADVVTTLESASQSDLTARLMETPLQVTFLTTLIAAGGRPPENRWRLFHDYYTTVYKREQQKSEGTFKEVFDRYNRLVDGLHYDAGFVLQLAGEEAGSTNAEMSMSEFATLVSARLSGDDWSGQEKEDLLNRIVDAARYRLVFLTSRVAGAVSFDVRSLQEFMAAERLMTGEQHLFGQRFQRVSMSPYWRNVFLFIAGNCFSSAQSDHLRPLVHLTAESLNDIRENPRLGAVKTGSGIAIDILEDGSTASSPLFTRKFFSLAFEILDLPADGRPHDRPQISDSESRLRTMYSREFDKYYRDFLVERVAIPSGAPSLRSWRLLLWLAERGIDWANEVAQHNWPADAAAQVAILQEYEMLMVPGSWQLSVVAEAVRRASPVDAMSIPIRAKKPGDIPSWLSAAASIDQMHAPHRAAHINAGDGPLEEYGLNFWSIDTDDAILDKFAPLLDGEFEHPWWELPKAIYRFLADPCAGTLADELEALVDLWSDDHNVFNSWITMPWPMASCAHAINNGVAVDEVLSKLRSLKLGDTADWREAESRWDSVGVTMADSDSFLRSSVGFDGDIATRGFPWRVCGLTFSSRREKLVPLTACVRLSEHAEDPVVKMVYARLATFILIDDSGDVSEVRSLLGEDLLKAYRLDTGLSLAALALTDWSHVTDSTYKYLNETGAALAGGKIRVFHRGQRKYLDTAAQMICARLISTPSETGHLAWLSLFSIWGFSVDVPKQLMIARDEYSDGLKVASLCLRLARLKDDSERVELEHLFFGLRRSLADEEVPRRVLMLLRHQAQMSAEQWTFLLNLRDVFKSESYRLLCEWYRVVEQKAGNVRSGLDNQAKCGELGLPVPLHR